MSTLRIRAGARFRLTCDTETPAVFIIRPETSGSQHVLSETWECDPPRAFHDYRDPYGNDCRRTMLAQGTSTVNYDVSVEIGGALDPCDPGARELPAAELPDEVLIYTLPSRYCLSDVLAPDALERFGSLPQGWSRVAAICDFVHGHLTFGYGSSTPQTTAVDAYRNAKGVCRDYAHLAITFCRALNIPARYAFGYLPDIDVPPPYVPMDFCAWFEAYLDGRWWIFDPRNNVRRRGRVTIARGRDATDVAMLTTYAYAQLDEMTVIADPEHDDVLSS